MRTFEAVNWVKIAVEAVTTDAVSCVVKNWNPLNATSATEAVFALLAVIANKDVEDTDELLALMAVIAVLAHEEVPAVKAYNVAPANSVNEAVNAHEAEVALFNKAQMG